MSIRVKKLLLITAAALVVPVVPAAAQSADTSDATQPDDDFHDDENKEIVVTARYVKQLDILAGTSVLSGDDLTKDLRGQIGDSLTSMAGISATSFAPGASRPVLRGFQGPRVRVLTDGIGSLDASNTSVDHAVAIDPLTAQRVEVLRGPAVLLFGGDAIGGAVNIIDKRIPREVPEAPFHLDALAGYGSAANDRSAAGSLDVPLTSTLVFHVDGSIRKTDDVKIGGYVLSPTLRGELLDAAALAADGGDAAGAAQLTNRANLSGTVPNTASLTKTAAASLAYIGDGGNIGFSVSRYESDYGVPERPGLDTGPQAPPVTIGLKQNRADLRASADLPGFFENITLRAGYSDYQHTEFEGSEVGTIFKVKGLESRLELTQAARGGWRGVVGAQLLARDFNAIGEEAFVPKNSIESAAIFTLQELELGELQLEGAARFDQTAIRAPVINFDRSFGTFSGAFGVAYVPGQGDLKFGINLSRSARAPSAEELLSNGPHVATEAFEIGNPNFTTEKSWGGELYARYNDDIFALSATVFGNLFSDYIFEAETGAVEDGLPVFQYFQQDATYYGFEASGSAKFAMVGDFDLTANMVTDLVHANIDNGGGPIPRIPPFRVLGGLEANSDYFDLRGEVEWSASQNRVATFETPSDSFTMVNASAAWRPFGKGGNLTLLASANNIFDVNARRHASFTKDYVPLSGRDIRVSARFSF
ncbi:MAG: iron complex outermembrane receptor protein [Parasphingorhabdus sp.]|jgi:iron complex outermembrane receptor protein